MRLRGGAHNTEFRQRLRRITRVRTGQQSLARQFAAQQRDALGLGQDLVVRRDARHLQQFRDDSRVDIGILPQIQRRQVKAEGLNRAIQARQRTAAIETHAARGFQ